mgnify:FL=1
MLETSGKEKASIVVVDDLPDHEVVVVKEVRKVDTPAVERRKRDISDSPVKVCTHLTVSLCIRPS